MAKIAHGVRRVVGCVLLKLHERPRVFVAEEKDAAELLVGEGLVQFQAFPLPAELVPPEDSHASIKKSATFHYTLTPEGIAFARRHDVDQLAGGRFRLPSEAGWLETALGKTFSRVAKLIVAAGVVFYLGLWFMGCTKEPAKPSAPAIRRGGDATPPRRPTPADKPDARAKEAPSFTHVRHVGRRLGCQTEAREPSLHRPRQNAFSLKPGRSNASGYQPTTGSPAVRSGPPLPWRRLPPHPAHRCRDRAAPATSLTGSSRTPKLRRRKGGTPGTTSSSRSTG